MLLQFLLLLFLLLIIYFLSRLVTARFYAFLFLLTSSEGFSMRILAVILLLGTIIHEVAHFLAATILRVPTGELSVMPEIESINDGKSKQVKAGKLEIVETDPFRQTLIGLAPMFVGLILIYVIGKLLLPDLSNILNTQYLILNTLCFFLFFVISITMFSSRQDLQSLIFIGPIILLVLISLYFIGVRVFFDEKLTMQITVVFSDLNLYLIIAGVTDFLVLLFVTANLSLWQKLLKKKITLR